MSTDRILRHTNTEDATERAANLRSRLKALRNGAPFEGLGAGGRHGGVRRKLAGADDGNRQMVDILTAMLTDGLAAVEAACAEAIACRCINANATKCCSSTSPASAKSFCIKSKRARAFAFAWSECRQTFGQREAQQLWKKLGLPELPAMADSFAQRNLLDLMNDKAA